MKVPKYAIIDTEYASWKGSLARNWSLPYEFPYLIELGIIKFESLKSKSYKKKNFIIKSSESKNVSLYFQKLTGISNSLINRKGLSFEKQFSEINYFLNDVKNIFCIGSDKEIIKMNISKHKIKVNFLNKIIDVRPLLAKIYKKNVNKIISSKLANFENINTNLKKHRALDDALSIYLCLKSLYKKKLLNEKILVKSC